MTHKIKKNKKQITEYQPNRRRLKKAEDWKVKDKITTGEIVVTNSLSNDNNAIWEF